VRSYGNTHSPAQACSSWLACVRQAVVCVFGVLGCYAFFLQSRLPGEVRHTG